MNPITFPGLNISLLIDRVAFQIGGIEIYWYAILIVSAFIIALLLCKKDDGKYQIRFDDILNLFVFIIPISIICARLYYIVFKLDYYIQNPLQIFNIRNGGLAIYGGIIGAVVTIIIYCKKKKLNVFDIFDYVVPYLALGQAIGRWGNFFNVEAYGGMTSNFLRMGIIKNGIYMEVHPTFLYESIGTFCIFILLYFLRNKRKYKGQITFIYLALYGLLRAIIEGLRTDSLMLGNIRISQLVSIILCITFTGALIYQHRKKKHIKEN